MADGFAGLGLWAQTIGPGGVSATPTADSPVLVAILALRRWCASLTLCPPEAAPGPISPLLWSWMSGLGGLLLIAAVIQGPRRALAQLFDVPGHLRLLREAGARLRRAGRMIAVVVGISIVSWTLSQAAGFARPQGREEVLLLLRGNTATDVAIGQGLAAALTPLRDVHLLGMMGLVLFVAMVVLFRFSTDRWGTTIRPPREIRDRVSRWATIGWTGAALYGFYYRLIGALARSGLPSGGCLIVEVVVVPALMALGAGIALAWILTELRGVAPDGTTGESVDVLGTVLLIPSAIVATVLSIPAAMLAMATLLLSDYVPAGSPPGVAVAPLLRWVLGWGLVETEAVGLIFVGMVGSVAWSGGRIGDAFRGYGRMLQAEGGRLVAAVGFTGLVGAVGSGAAYAVLLNLPASTWVLGAADSYAHYLTLPVGLLLTAALVELGERSLPLANEVELVGKPMPREEAASETAGFA